MRITLVYVDNNGFQWDENKFNVKNVISLFTTILFFLWNLRVND